MSTLRRWLLPILGASLLAAGCGTARHVERPRAARATRTIQTPPATSDLYATDEALRDALSSPWQYVGTGRWPGINRMHACAFRNDRVLIVNVYCTLNETPAFRVDVYSPSRGRVRIYAETRGPVSAHSRHDYFTFAAESEPPPGPQAHLAPLAVTMTFKELRDYDAQRHAAVLPACYGGTELSRERGGCLGPLAPRASAWAARNRSFLEHANDDWYRLVRQARTLASRHGWEPE